MKTDHAALEDSANRIGDMSRAHASAPLAGSSAAAPPGPCRNKKLPKLVESGFWRPVLPLNVHPQILK
jgi:hypothetical protein